MTTPVYLDTARLGVMSPAAARAGQEFLRLAGEEGASPLADLLLHEGFSAWPQTAQQRFPGLSCWGGLDALRESLRRLAGAPPGSPVLLANRSAQLAQLAAQLLVRQCRRIVTTDLEWPAYAAMLARECERWEQQLVCVPLRQHILADRCSADDLSQAVAEAASFHACDGAFLTAVTYEGFRLPVERTVSLLPEAGSPPFVVIDGAQALGHSQLDLTGGLCDLYLAGCHKWLGAYQLLGLAVCPRPSSQPVITTLAEELLAEGELDDPLLSLAGCWRRGQSPRFTETVALPPLFTAAAAAGEQQETPSSRFARLCAAGAELRRAGEEAGWQPLQPHASLQSGIVLLAGARADSPDELRRRFYASGVTLTAYEGGILRVAAPPCGLGPDGYERFRAALRQCG